jgi:Putative  PD-(D/E)XK family member, (DUF4420)
VTSTSEQAFEELTVAGVTLGEIRVRESEVMVGGEPVLHGLNTKGSRHLLVPVVASEEAAEDRRSAGVQIHLRTLLDDGTEHRFLDVVCLRHELRELYSIVADEMIAAIAERPEAPARMCRDVLERWRELLEAPKLSILGIERQAALLAELEWVVRLAQRNPAVATGAWRGPLMDRHDFMSGTTALEVKSTMAREGRFTEIHGERQLEAPDGGRLYLGFHRYERVGEGGISLPDHVDAALAAGVDRKQLLGLLSQVGYDSRDAETYRQFRFRLEELRVYSVDAAFPKVIPASFEGGTMPERVGSVRYVIDLEGEPPSPLSDSDVTRLITTMAGDD